MPQHENSVLVVGAGVFGASAALELRARGWIVTLLDRATGPHPDASSTDISKMIRMDYGADVFYHELAEAALEGWDRWNAEWPRRLFHDEGFLVLSPGPMRPGSFEYESRRVLSERGYTPETIDAAELARRCPAWNAERYPEAYLSPRGGWAESGAVVSQLIALCEAEGVEIRTGRVRELVENGSRVTGVTVRSDQGDDALLECSHVAVCAGAWTPRLVPQLRGALKAVAQPIVHFGVEDPSAFRGSRFPAFAADTAGTGWYGFPALDDGRVKLGHHGDGREVHPDERGVVADGHIERARAFWRESVPTLADAPVVGTRVCLYCDTFDGDLIIDRDPGRAGLTVAAGGSGHGFKFAPMLGPLIADAVEGRHNRWAGRFRWRTTGEPRVEAARFQTREGRTR